MKKKLFSVALVCIWFTCQLSAFAAAPKVLWLSNIHIRGNYYVGADYESVVFENVKIDGIVSFEGSASSISVSVESKSALGGIVFNREGVLENEGTIKALQAEKPVRVNKQGRIDCAVLNAETNIENDGKIIILRDGKALNKTGLISVLGDDYFAGDDGALAKGIVDSGSLRYFFDGNYLRKTGFVTYNGSVYYFYPSGTKATGLKTIENKKYFFDTDSKRKTGFVTFEGNEYYIYASGTLARGITTINSKKYYFDADGKRKTGYIDIGNEKYYYYPEGGMAVNTMIGNYRADYDGTLNYTLTDNTELDDAVAEILRKATNSSMTDREKMLAIYKWMPANIDWRNIYVDISNGIDNARMRDLALYCIRNGKGACEHYASLEGVIIKRLGYKVKVLSGKRLSLTTGQWGDHSWIRITINGGNYHFDPQYAQTHMKNNILGCFLITSEEFKKTHRWTE